MAAYNPYPQQSAYPAYTTTQHHPASAHPNLYHNSAYSIPALAAPAQTQTMPTYYVSSSSPHHHHHSSSTRRSRSRSRHSAQPIVYTTSSSGHHGQPYVVSQDYGHSGRPRRASDVGQGGHYYYTTSDRSPRHRSHSRSPRQATYYTTSAPTHRDSSRRRSHSTSRHGTNVQYLDAHHGSHGSRRPSVSYSDSGHHYRSSHSHSRRNSDSLGERFRRWFGGLGHHHSSSRGTEYVDARTGQPVDRSGRPIYRV